MSITIENLPIVFLIIVGIGMVVVLIGILRLANEQEHRSVYTNLEESDHNGHLEDLFSFFLQEEEKKNQSFRDLVMNVTKTHTKHEVVENIETEKEIDKVKKIEEKEQKEQKEQKPNIKVEQEIYKEIIERYEMGQNVETIAKELRKGTGEIKLIISLYARR